MSTSSKSDPVQVLIRTRPTDNPCKELNSKGDQTIGIQLGHQGKGVEGGVNNQTTEWSFKFDGLLPNSTQEQVYDIAAKDIVESVLQGVNGTIMVYGQTGAGKTYTMNGSHLDYETRGLIPRAIGHIFRAIGDRPDLNFRASVSYVEIYNEHLFDLLAEKKAGLSRNPALAQSVELALQEDVNNGAISIRGLNKKSITNEQECLDALFFGDANRSVGEHALNEQSTRSHCIYTLYLEIRSRIESSEKVLHSKLNLIDLAGSERVGKTHSSGVILHEAKFINKSLTFLEQVVVALTSKNRDHIPFRQSRLTQLLKDSLGGNARTRVICNIRAEKAHLEETISTLKFGARMRNIMNKVSVNIALDPLLHVAKLQREIRELKHELAMHDTLANRLGISYEAYTPEESALLRKRVEKYIQGGPAAEEIEIVNLRQVRETFRVFKAIALELQAKGGANGVKGNTQTLPSSYVNESSPDAIDPSLLVGDVDEDLSGGFGVGMVAADRRPPSRPDSRDEPLKPKNIMRRRAKEAGNAVASPDTGRLNTAGAHARAGSAGRRGAAAAGGLPALGRSLNKAGGGNLPVVRPTSAEEKHNHALYRQPSSAAQVAAIQAQQAAQVSRVTAEAAAFEDFKRSSSGFDLNELLLSTKSHHSSQKKLLREASIAVNDTKRRIDDLSSAIASSKARRSSDSALATAEAAGLEVLDEEEYQSIQALAQAKNEYKSYFATRQQLEASVIEAEGEVQEARSDLMNAFHSWYVEHYGAAPSMQLDTLSPAQREARLKAMADAKLMQAQQLAALDAQLDPEARSFAQATRNFNSSKLAARPLLNGGRRPVIGAAFK